MDGVGDPGLSGGAAALDMFTEGCPRGRRDRCRPVDEGVTGSKLHHTAWLSLAGKSITLKKNSHVREWSLITQSGSNRLEGSKTSLD